MTRIALAGVTGLLAAIGGYAACPSDIESVCTTDAKPSVHIQINERIDGRLVPTRADSVRYLVNAHPAQEGPRAAPKPVDAECLNDQCSEWAAGREVTGEFTVTASVCGKEFSDIALVEMDDTDCHVVTEDLMIEVDRSACDPTIEIAPAPVCTLELRPSGIVRSFKKIDGRVIPARPASVVYRPAEETRKPFPLDCADDSCTVHYGPWERAGDFIYEATYCGETMRKKVHVPMTGDKCHVETQTIDFTFTNFSESCVKEKPTKPTRPDGPASITAPESCSPDSLRDPAFIARTYHQVGDMLVPLRATSATYKVASEDGREPTWDANCLDGRCSVWGGASQGAGKYSLTATVCDVETTTSFAVVAKANGCGVLTAFPYMELSTRGCVTPIVEEGDPPSGPIWKSDKPWEPWGPVWRQPIPWEPWGPVWRSHEPWEPWGPVWRSDEPGLPEQPQR